MNGKGKIYIYDKLIFEGEYFNGKRWEGKGKEYNYGKLVFEGGYLNEKEMGKEKNINMVNWYLKEDI